MVSSFLDKTGLAYLWGKITALVGGKQDALTFDSTPTANSTNPVTSAGIKSYVDENAGGDAPVENGTGVGSVQSKAYVIDSTTYTQNASGDGATAIGENTIAKGEASSARGINTLASGKGSSAEGYGNVVTINVTCDAGSSNASYTETSTAFPSGVSTAYILDPSDSTLYYVASINSNAHTFRMVPAPESAMSNKTMVVMVHCASGQASHTEGSQTWAVGNYSHAEGYDTKAGSEAVHAEGFQTKASGVHSHVEGHGCTASSEAQHVQGKFNIVDSSGTYAHIVGNGTGNGTGRSNAHTLDWSGNAWYAGKVSAGTVANPAPVTNANDLATKAYVDANAGGDSPVESGTGTGSVQSKSYTNDSVTYTQQATGNGATALGGNTTAGAECSFAEGLGTYANGKAAHAEGLWEKNTIVVSGTQGNRYLTLSSSTYPVTAGDIGKAIQNTNGGYRYTIVDVRGNIITVNNDVTTFSNQTLQIATPTTAASGTASHKEGYTTLASGAFAHAEGSTAWASGIGAHAEGCGSKATANAAHAEGNSTNASGAGTHAEGCQTYAHNEASHVEGFGSKALGTTSHAEGRYTYAYGDYSHTEGSMTLAPSYYSQHAHAEGNLTVARGSAAHAEGAGNLVSSLTLTGDTNDGYVYPQSQASTASTLKRGDALYTYNSALTPSTRFLGIVGLIDQANRTIFVEEYDGPNELDNETVRMIRHVAYGSYSHSEGYDCKAYTTGSHAEGASTVAGVDTLRYDPGDEYTEPYTYEDIYGDYCHAEGSFTHAYGGSSHAGGSSTYAIGNDSFATNFGVVAYGQSSTAFGYSLTETVMSLTGTSDPTIYNYSGYTNVQVGMIGYLDYNGFFCAHAVTQIDSTNHRITFDGAFNIAENETKNVSFKYGGAVGENSFIEGYQTSAIGKNAHAEGHETIALGDNQHTFGVLNERDENGNYAIIVGNGTPEDNSHAQAIRSNAYTLDWSGNGWFAGNITANGGSLTLHDNQGNVTITAAQLRSLLALI